MKCKHIFIGTLFLFSSFLYSQKLEYALLLLDSSLKENANAIVRNSTMEITIESQSKMSIKSIEAVTVLNELGLKNLDLSENYDKSTKITKIEARVYDAFGKETKKFKEKDFRDVSVNDGFSVFSDNRVLYLDYTPVGYPFTIEIIKEVETSNTVFIPSWSPFNDYYCSTENSSINIIYNQNFNLNFKEINFSSDYNIIKKNINSSIHYEAKNLKSKKKEDLAPSYEKLFPKVIFGLDNFNLEGVEGKAKTWGEMGNWFYNEILSGTTDLPEETKIKIKKIVENEKDPIKKAEIVYKYVQDKTRYVSIQEGIGGWKPMKAKDVDRLGYGDCKALSNYTRALLNEVGVVSYYARLYGQSNIKEIHEEVVSFQSNHVILAIPNNNDYLWLECTSQILPFGFQGDFTDNRNAFIIKPEGSGIVKTNSYINKDNSKLINGHYSLSSEGNLSGKIAMISKGIMYDSNFGTERLSKEDQVKHYKEHFSNINNLKINKIDLKNDRNNIQFFEDLELSADAYATPTNGKLMFILNAFDQNAFLPKKYKNRENPFEIARGNFSEEELKINLPQDYVIEAMPEGISIDSKYGEYKTTITKNEDHSITYKRTFLLKKGFYQKEEYEEFRTFLEKVSKNDNARAILTKK